jgi:hypothetical protein
MEKEFTQGVEWMDGWMDGEFIYHCLTNHILKEIKNKSFFTEKGSYSQLFVTQFKFYLKK